MVGEVGGHRSKVEGSGQRWRIQVRGGGYRSKVEVPRVQVKGGGNECTVQMVQGDGLWTSTDQAT